MGILTKISIVILLVLILLACPVFITQAMLTPTYLQGYQTKDMQAQILEQAVRLANLEVQKVKLDRDQLAARLTQDAGSMQTEMDNLKAALAGERSRSAKLENDLSSINAELSKMRADNADNSKRTATLADQRDKDLKKIEALSAENRRLEELSKQTSLDLDRQSQIVSTLREQLVDREDRIKSLEGRLGSSGGAPGATVAAPEKPAAAAASEVRINGTVTAVKGDVVSINVGSAKGVKAGMRLIIYRAGNYVGMLRVEQVDVGSAAGTTFNKLLDVAQGDKVADSMD
ncbi:MAG: hypothetical protein WC869_10770 [Phycisphaerae bacterium]